MCYHQATGVLRSEKSGRSGRMLRMCHNMGPSLDIERALEKPQVGRVRNLAACLRRVEHFLTIREVQRRWEVHVISDDELQEN